MKYAVTSTFCVDRNLLVLRPSDAWVQDYVRAVRAERGAVAEVCGVRARPGARDQRRAGHHLDARVTAR